MALPALDVWQYRVSTEPAADAFPVGAFWLEVGPNLPCIAVSDRAGIPVGILLGFPIDLAARRIVDGPWTAPAAPRSGIDLGIDALAVSILEALGGCFLLILAAGSAARIYPDSMAQVPCVYDPALRRAGSTAAALLDDAEYQRRFDQASFDRLGVEGQGWFLAGVTAHRGLRRVLANHYLDLSGWTDQRFWPAGQLEPLGDPSAAVDEVVEIVRAQIEALVAGPGTVAQALTAGLDTRTLLACARPYLSGIEFVTVVGGDRHQNDTVVSRQIAAELGLRFRELPRREATEAQQATFLRRGGHCNGDTNRRYHPSVWPIARSHVYVGGLGGEVGRGWLWRDGDQPDTVITSRTLLGRFGLPETDEVRTSLDARLAEMEGMDALQKLDLAYLEDRMSAWSSAQFFSDPTLVRHHPLVTKRSMELMLRLPADWKREKRLAHEMVRRCWPEIERFPYKSIGRSRDLLIKLRLALANPRVVLKKLRQLRT